MKKIQIFLLLSLVCLFTVSCEEDTPQTVREVKTYDSFIIKEPSFSSESKAFFDFASSSSRILYEDGDVIYVNGKSFTLHQYGNETDGYYWKAEGSESVTSDLFYCCFADGTVSNYNESDYSYKIDFTGNYSTTSGIFFADTTSTNVLTFHPRFAILVLESNLYDRIQVGFDEYKVPRIFTIACQDGFISVSSRNDYYNPANSATPQTMMTMKRKEGYFYVAVPIVGESVNTKLYFQYYKSGESTPTQRVTQQAVTLEPGKVYGIPSEDISNYPFDENGASKKVFSVSSTRTVRFSAGNLQCKPSALAYDPDQNPNAKAWRFAPHQYDKVAKNNNLHLSVSNSYYMDLFAWATSGFMDNPYDGTHNPEDYGNGENDIAETEDDWGYNSSNIYYGNRRTTLSWRTLTQAEWQYLLYGRGNKYAYAIIDDDISGLIILPDQWSPGLGWTWFTKGALNSITMSQWDQLESRGAIFLPACGYRYFDSFNEEPEVVNSYNSQGFYWSSTHYSKDGAKALSFTIPDLPNTPSNNADRIMERQMGLSVRLVTNAN